MVDEIIRILSIDGGGIRRNHTARLLQRIEESVGDFRQQPLSSDCRYLDWWHSWLRTRKRETGPRNS